MKRTVALLSCCGSLATALALPAVSEGAHVFTRCGIVEIGRSDYRVRALNVSCRTAESGTRLFLTRGRSPRGFTCRRVRTPGVRVVMSCRRSENVSFYAERR
jgi:hypothetical protein